MLRWTCGAGWIFVGESLQTDVGVGWRFREGGAGISVWIYVTGIVRVFVVLMSKRRFEGGREYERRGYRRADGGARYLARIHGTEQDAKNCPFYHKMGACRHGATCSRVHIHPKFSRVVLLKHLWNETLGDEEYEDFYVEVYTEFERFGVLESLCVVDNDCEHLRGSVYATYVEEECAIKMQEAMHGRYYDGRVIEAEFSPVHNLIDPGSDGRCKQYDRSFCSRGGQCNYLHLKPLTATLKKDLKLVPKERLRSVMAVPIAPPVESAPKSALASVPKSTPEPAPESALVAAEADEFLQGLA
jgi:splicing factor U2AF 35 kDa subunit